MPNHCRCCSGKFLENDVLGDCPGCQECADAAEWHKVIMEESCDGGPNESHCTCVPVLRKACAEKDAEIATLQATTRRVVEAAREADDFMSKHAAPWFSSGEMVLIQHRLRDAIAFVALGRE